MTQKKWFERKFDFDYQDNIFPEIIKRLTTKHPELEKLVDGLSSKTLEIKPDDTWSIKENIGHLSDLEPLWQGRLKDILSDEEYLRPADLQNKKTDLASHNNISLDELLLQFSALRATTIQQLTQLKADDVYKSALHPRLKTPMRVIDLFYFVAEHDDHHLARIEEIIKANS